MIAPRWFYWISLLLLILINCSFIVPSSVFFCFCLLNGSVFAMQLKRIQLINCIKLIIELKFWNGLNVVRHLAHNLNDKLELFMSMEVITNSLYSTAHQKRLLSSCLRIKRTWVCQTCSPTANIMWTQRTQQRISPFQGQEVCSSSTSWLRHWHPHTNTVAPLMADAPTFPLTFFEELFSREVVVLPKTNSLCRNR